MGRADQIRRAAGGLSPQQARHKRPRGPWKPKTDRDNADLLHGRECCLCPVETKIQTFPRPLVALIRINLAAGGTARSGTATSPALRSIDMRDERKAEAQPGANQIGRVKP